MNVTTDLIAFYFYSIFDFRLVDRNYKLKFVTNTTKESKARIINRLSGVGLDVKPSDIYSSLSITRDYIKRKGKIVKIN